MWPEVRPERTGWRDQRMSERHRHWGWNCPAVDIDFLLCDYDKGKSVALIEYKHESAKKQDLKNASYRALIDLGNRARLPVFFCRYKHDFTLFRVIPLNTKAKEWIARGKDMSEREYVTLLYAMRGYGLPQNLLKEYGGVIT